MMLGFNRLWRALILTALVPTLALASPVRDLSVPMLVLSGYDKARLVGHWYEVAQTASALEQNCHGTTADVALREDGRLILKIACHKGSLGGTVLPIEGVVAQTDPGIFLLRLVHLLEFGNVQLDVLWQAKDDSMAAIGAPMAEVGWIWSKTAQPDAAGLATARAALVTAGYRASAIRKVEQAP